MKIAEEWNNQIKQLGDKYEDNLAIIKAIQLDAWKNGIIQAYELAPKNCNEQIYFYEKTIYNLLDNPPKTLL